MSRGPENNFIAAIHKLLPPKLYRMKNHNQFNAGIADCWYSGVKRDLWVEYKFVTIPKRDDTVIKFGFSELQVAWLDGRNAEGRFIATVIGSSEGGVILGVTSGTIREMTTEKFRAHLRTKKEIAQYITTVVGGPM